MGAEAVLLVAFNRPERTRRCAAALVRAGADKVYVHVDGAREHVPDEALRVAQVLDVIAAADWPGEVQVRASQANLGCAGAVRAGLDWFFASEPRGLVVEDDVEIAPGGLELARGLFEAGERDVSVGSVSLFCTVPPARLAHPGASYRKSLLASTQGWGTWRETWTSSRRSLADWRAWLPTSRLRELGGLPLSERWTGLLDRDARHGSPTWDYTWQAHLWATQPYTLVANRNHIGNEGFDQDATFSPVRPPWWPESIEPWTGPLIAPPGDGIDPRAERWEMRHRVAISPVHTLRRSVARAVPPVSRAYRRLRYGPGDWSSH